MDIDLEKEKERLRRNREERLKFIDLYVEWLKKTPNEVWSRQQRKLMGKS